MNVNDQPMKMPSILQVIVDESNFQRSDDEVSQTNFSFSIKTLKKTKTSIINQQIESNHSDEKSESSVDPEEEIYKNITEEQLHRARKHFECFICQQRCGSFTSFRSHVRGHTRVEKFECEQCSKIFSKLRYLKAHLTTHNENRIFTCEICSQNFVTKPSIRGHMRTHTGESIQVLW